MKLSVEADARLPSYALTLAVSALVPRLGLTGAAELYLVGVILLAALGVRNSLPRACSAACMERMAASRSTA